MHRILLALALNLPLLPALAGQLPEKVDFRCDAEFETAVHTNEMLLVAGVDVAKAPDGKTYLLALGTAKNPGNELSGARAKVNIRTVAEAKARKQLAEFLQTEVFTETKLTEIRDSKKVSSSDGLKQQFAKITRIREEIIIQRSQAVLGGSRVVATWLSDDNSIFNAVVAVHISAKEILPN